MNCSCIRTTDFKAYLKEYSLFFSLLEEFVQDYVIFFLKCLAKFTGEAIWARRVLFFFLTFNFLLEYS